MSDLRWTVACFGLLLVLAVPPAASVLTDARGDVSIEAGPGAPSPTSEPADLIGLTIDETVDVLGFRLETAIATDPARDADIDIYFSWREREFRLSLTTGGDDFPRGCALAHRAIGAHLWDRVMGAEATVEGSTSVCPVPRSLIQDSVGRVPARDDRFSGIHAQSEDGLTTKRPVGQAPAPGEFAHVVDRMPDAGFGEYEVRFGGEELPSLHLASPDPFRFSNGEATAHVFPVTIVNQGDTAHVSLRVEEVPKGWVIAVPRPPPVSGQSDLEVVAVVPFVHVHGNTSTFSLELVQGSEVMHNMSLGVHYFATPQPSGHHPRLWVHASQPAAPGSDHAERGHFMNTVKEDERDTGAAVAPKRLTDSMGSTTGFQWCIPLDERLRIGIDQDVAGQGELSFDLLSDVEHTGTLRAQVVIVANTEDEADPRFELASGCRGRPVATLVEADPIPGFKAPASNVKVPLHPDLDRLAPSDGRQVFLEVSLELDEPALTGGALPRWAAGASVSLPLRDYHATVRAGGASLDAGDVRYDRQPGTTALLRTTLTGPDGVYDITAPGTHEGWVEVMTPTARPGSTVVVAVRIPPDAAVQSVDHFVIASGPSIGMARLSVHVDPMADPVDDADGLGEKDKPTPAGVPLSVIALLTAGLALAHRSRVPPGPSRQKAAGHS